MEQYKSKIDPEFTIYKLYKGDKYYDDVIEIMPDDLAYTDLTRKIIFIDGTTFDEENLTNDHFNFITAHEIAHHRLNHSEIYNGQEQEIEADIGAYIILNKLGYSNSAKLVPYYFNQRHNGINFDDEYKKFNRSQLSSKL